MSFDQTDRVYVGVIVIHEELDLDSVAEVHRPN